MKKRVVSALLCAAMAVSLMAGCGSTNESEETQSDASEEETGSEKDVLKIGTTAANEQLTEAVREALEEAGYEMEIVMFQDPVQPNTALDAGEIDASFNEHEAYMQTFNDEQGYNLKFMGSIIFGPFCCYSSKYESIDDLPDGAQITISSDASNKDRSLKLLEDLELIKLSESPQYGDYYIAEDIIENPKNIEFIEAEGASIPTTLNDVDMIVVYNPNMYAGDYDTSGLLYTEEYTEELAPMAQGVVINGDNEDEPWVEDLMTAFTSETTKKNLEEVNDGSFIVVF
ncbi:MetQ/NlpA family ABC transporter substrate-binding protein [Mordavella massiliensis]|uniref:MetQ/NlpA family ABC transporter substrate-binding protein n=1 Tax=Mordavella massiliensis TaxID=1871024 RepID=UPI00210D2BCB|nr:MetQ/NlpA family ABC transporter substrate-binding protein [Mordavella massiliensis]